VSYETGDFDISKRGPWKIFCLIVSVPCKLFGVKFFPVGRDYERKELESSHSKAPGGLEFSLWSPLSPV